MRPPDIVVDLAPLVRLHPDERYWPMAAETFLERASLEWATGDGLQTDHVAGAVDALLLTGRGQPAYSHLPPPVYAGEHTRPYDRDNRAANLPETEGFCLSLLDAAALEGDGTTAPAYFDWDPEAARITYWFFYGASTVPFRLLHLVPVWTFDIELEIPSDFDPIAAFQAARAFYPDLVQEPEPVIDTGTTLMRVSDERAAWEQLKRLYSYFQQAPDFPVLHEGDWERITVQLDDRSRPHDTVYHQHKHPEPLLWQDLEREGSHPVVYSAEGSHASYPHQSRVLDRARDGGSSWRTWENLVDVHQPWYGFGGAWGRIGPFAEATGPLGPSQWKR